MPQATNINNNIENNLNNNNNNFENNMKKNVNNHNHNTNGNSKLNNNNNNNSHYHNGLRNSGGSLAHSFVEKGKKVDLMSTEINFIQNHFHSNRSIYSVFISLLFYALKVCFSDIYYLSLSLLIFSFSLKFLGFNLYFKMFT